MVATNIKMIIRSMLSTTDVYKGDSVKRIVATNIKMIIHNKSICFV